MELYDQTNLAHNALRKLRRATADAIAAQKIAQRDYEQAQAEADEWERQYQIAVKEGRQDIARQAQFQHERYKAIVCKLEALVNQQTSQVATMKLNLTSWESKVSQAQDELLRRQKEVHIKAVSQLENINVGSEQSILDKLEKLDDPLARMKAELIELPKPQEQAANRSHPEEILEEAVQQTRQAVASTFASIERIQQQYNQASKEAKHQHQQAQLALQKDDENLAFQALISKTVQGKVATAFKIQLEQQEATLKLLIPIL